MRFYWLLEKLLRLEEMLALSAFCGHVPSFKSHTSVGYIDAPHFFSFHSMDRLLGLRVLFVRLG